MSLATFALAVFVLNLPFGFWRCHGRKYSLPWFLAIHLPVPLIVALRLGSGIGWRFASFPLLVAAFAGGQSVGGLLYKRWSARR